MHKHGSSNTIWLVEKSTPGKVFDGNTCLWEGQYRYISLYLPISPRISPCGRASTAISPYFSPYLPASPHISLGLPIPPRISLHCPNQVGGPVPSPTPRTLPIPLHLPLPLTPSPTPNPNP